MLVILFAFITPVVCHHVLPMCTQNDYSAFRTFAMFSQTYPPDLIYDYSVLQRFQGTSTLMFPYSYQPQMLLVVWPLAHLPYAPGYALWMLPGMLLCAVVLGSVEVNSLAVAAVLVGPSTLLVWINGQSSMLAAGLMFGGFALLPRRPVLAGMLFGLMAYKPQLGVLVPVALVAARQWRSLASACGTALLFMAMSAVVFGFDVWTSWWYHLPTIAATIAVKTMEVKSSMATVTTNLLMLGATSLQAHCAQGACFLAMAVLVWRCFRERVCMLGAALVGAGTFLATPYAYGYDLAVFNFAVIVTASECWRRHGSFSFLEIVILVLGFLLPWCVISPVMFCFSSVVVGAVVCVILRRIKAVRGNSLGLEGGSETVTAMA